MAAIHTKEEEAMAEVFMRQFARTTREFADAEDVTIQAVQQRHHRGLLFTRRSTESGFNWVFDPAEAGQHLVDQDARIASLEAMNRELLSTLEEVARERVMLDDLLAALKGQVTLQQELLKR
jgi:hypothetical protein